MKAPYLATCGYEFLEKYTDNLSKVKPGDISAVAKKYFAEPEYVASALAPGKEGK